MAHHLCMCHQICTHDSIHLSNTLHSVHPLQLQTVEKQGHRHIPLHHSIDQTTYYVVSDISDLIAMKGLFLRLDAIFHIRP